MSKVTISLHMGSDEEVIIESEHESVHMAALDAVKAKGVICPRLIAKTAESSTTKQ